MVNGELTVTCTYTDDVSGMSNIREGYEKAVKELGEDFEIKDLGELKSVIGMEVERRWEEGMLLILQEDYIHQILKHFGFQDCALKYTPLPTGINL